MDITPEELIKLKDLVQRIASNQTMEQAGKLYDHGLANYKSSNYSVSMAQFQAVIETGDPYYMPSAVWMVYTLHRQFKDRPNELATLKRFVSLPPESSRFIDPENLGIAYIKLGDAANAVKHYSLAIKQNGETPARIANLAEAYLVSGDYRNSLELADKLVTQNEVKYLLLGRVFKGASLWFMGQHPQALSEFQFIGSFLASTGGLPANFSWDFRDSAQILDRIESPVIRSVVEVLSGRANFDTFRQSWLGATASA